MKEYKETHPWITFKATDIKKFGPKLWIMLGEAQVFCEQLLRTPGSHYLATNFYKFFLIRAVRATTAIEGNTLNKDQVGGILEGTFKAPPSRQYQEREVRNIAKAIEGIFEGLRFGLRYQITAELICDLNNKVLAGTHMGVDVVPGEIRTHSVFVGDYEGAPARDCDYLLNRLADWLESDWLESDIFRSNAPDTNFALTLTRAVLAHLYIAWIHPFGDGNGRTARLLEFLILARSGLTFSTTHALWNHYYKTRDRYYRELSNARRSSSAYEFLFYSIEGFRDRVHKQVKKLHKQQLSNSWFAFTHEMLDKYPSSPARERQKLLALSMPSDETLTREEIPKLNPKLTALYAVKGPRTLSRDLQRLQNTELIKYDEEQKGWTSNFETMANFLLPRARMESPAESPSEAET